MMTVLKQVGATHSHQIVVLRKFGQSSIVLSWALITYRRGGTAPDHNNEENGNSIINTPI